jgi:phenylalanyl-tRNA synthetase beta chain
MKFTLSWLKDHLDTSAPLDVLTEALTDLGLEVEEVVNPAAKLAPFTLAKILHAEKHPDADGIEEINAEKIDDHERRTVGLMHRS